jgi:beta-phosphoglucomutase-like phosphatase (HAD superfamily)
MLALPLDRLDAVVFDTDGVLTDTAPVHAAAWARLFDGARAFPASADLVVRLRTAGLRTAVVSSSRNLRAVLASAGLRGLFDAEVDGIEAARLGLPGKPHPALFLEAARRLGVAPHRAAVVEDAPAGVEAGRRGGFGLVIGVDRGGQAAALAEHGADLVVADLGELAFHGGRVRQGDR